MFILDTEKLIQKLKEEGDQPLWEYALNQEMERSGRSREELREQMDQSLAVMERSASTARKEPVQSVSGLTGGNACRYEQYRGKGNSLLGDTASLAVGMALSCSEINASMQCIVACPTAGSCGIVPAVLLACAQSRGLDRQTLINALFTASAVGIIVGSRATVSGAEGGCQAECGAAAAMGAAAVTEMLGGRVKEVRLSHRLKSNPVCLAVDGDVSIEMEKVLNSMPTKDKVQSQKVLELNPDHPVFQSLVGAYNSEDTQKLRVYTALLYDQAMLIGGLNIEDPVTFTNHVCELMK